MASDTATGPLTAATDDCVGFARPAEILTRLTPDDLHPARLAGPHAWHPWGLAQAPPTDRQIRLTLPPNSRPEIAARILDRLEHQLARTPWPPVGPIDIHRHGTRLDCRDDYARRSLIEVHVAADGEVHGQTGVVTRDGWPILDELAALNDRIHCINPDQPSRTDLADLAGWVENKMAQLAGTHQLAASLPQILADQTRDHSAAADSLRTILTQRETMAGHPLRVLTHLAEQLDQHERPSKSLGR